jgi:hypothetical protein
MNIGKYVKLYSEYLKLTEKLHDDSLCTNNFSAVIVY